MHYTVGPPLPYRTAAPSVDPQITQQHTHKLTVQKRMQMQLHNRISDTFFFHTQTHFNPRGDSRGPGGQRKINSRLVSIETLTNKIIFMHSTSHKHAPTYYTSPWRQRPHGHRPLASYWCCYCIQKENKLQPRYLSRGKDKGKNNTQHLLLLL